MCIFARVYISSSTEQHVLECWTSFFFSLLEMLLLSGKGLTLRPWQSVSEYTSSGEGSGVFKGVNETISFLFDVPLIKLLMHAVDNYF